MNLQNYPWGTLFLHWQSELEHTEKSEITRLPADVFIIYRARRGNWLEARTKVFTATKTSPRQGIRQVGLEGARSAVNRGEKLNRNWKCEIGIIF